MAASNDDYADFMEKAQAKFKERNAILQNSTPIPVKEKPMETDKLANKSDNDSKVEPVKKAKEWKTPTKQTDQSVKENINKFERIASGSKVVYQKEDYKTVSVKDMKRRFENNSSAVFPTTRGPKPPKSPKVSFSSPTRPVVQHRTEPNSPKTEASPFKHEVSNDVSRDISQNVSHVSEQVQIHSPRQNTPPSVVLEEHEVNNEEQESLEVKVPPSPATLFGNRLLRTMEPLTPRRARLMDEINEDFQKHSDSLPRRRSHRTLNFDEDANDDDDSVLMSLKEYRQGTLERTAGTSSDGDTIEKLNYASVQNFDSTDSAAPKRNLDRIRQLDEFVEVCSAQHEQAKKALSLIISKSERSEEELVAANHILLNHRVVLEAALRMRKKLDFYSKKLDGKSKNLPEMRSAFTFKSVAFELDPEFLHDICTDGSSCYFTVVIGHNETTRSSAPVSYHVNNKCRITLDDFYCAIDNVEPGFEIYVEIYMLKIPKMTEKRHKFTDAVGTLLRGEKPRQLDLRFMDSQFQRIGIAVINHTNMGMRHIQANTTGPLAPRFDVIFDHHVMESTHHLEGYLRRFEIVAGVGNWSMEYMTFNSWFFDFYTTHRDKLENKPAIRSINLRRCLDVAEVSDSACYPHAFSVSYESEDGQKEKLLLAANTKQEQDQWLKVLKGFVDGLKYWS